MSDEQFEQSGKGIQFARKREEDKCDVDMASKKVQNTDCRSWQATERFISEEGYFSQVHQKK